MRSADVIEAELLEIGAIPDDSYKLERIITWCATHPEEVPFALQHFVGLHSKSPGRG